MKQFFVKYILSSYRQRYQRIIIICFLLLAFFVPYNNAITANVLPGSECQEPFDAAVALYYKGDLNGSIQTFRQIIESNPGNDKARLNLVQLLRETGQYQEAVTHLTYLSNKNQTDPAYRLALMETSYLGGKPDQVPSYFKQEETSAESLFWLGLAYMDLGKYEEAQKSLKESLDIQGFNPMALYFLGQIALKTGQFESAENYFKKTITQDYNLTICYYPLVKAYLAQEKAQPAYDLLLKSVSALPWDQAIAAELKSLKEFHPEFEQKRAAASVEKRKIANPPSVKPITQGRELIPEVRIGLLEKAKHFYLKTGGEFRIAEREGDQRIDGKAKTILQVRQNGKEIEVLDEDGNLLIHSTKRLVLSYQDPGSTSVLFDADFGQGYFWAGQQDRFFRGSLEFLLFDQGLTVVNRVNVEEYLYAVVPSEVPASWPQAVLEAQAVAARTYTFANLGRFESRGFDLLPTVASQAYNGVQMERSSVTEAVDATRGMILTYGGKPINAFYFDSCGGYTESSQSVWGFSAPYLQPVPDKLLPPRTSSLPPEELFFWLRTRPEAYVNNPKYSARSAYRWTLWVTREEIEARLKLPEKIGRLTSLTVTERSISGRASKVLLKGTIGEYTVKGDAIRAIAGLRSNLFVVQPKLGADGLPEYFVFNGGGWGHGVGMPQSGAAGMAAAGFSSFEILTYYYQGTELTRKY